MLRSTEITVGARASLLSRRQVEEVYQELQLLHPTLHFRSLYVDTRGDREQTISLRTLDKTDFFTREIDLMVLQHVCRIAIHSAKDLPDPLPQGLCVVAVTRGVDPSDSLVYREEHLLPVGAVIGASSIRREESVRLLFPTARCVDIRGTIQVRLQKLNDIPLDGVVIAEAALIRLGLTHLPRLRLPGETTPLQGRLAIITREDDLEMRALFAPLDAASVYA